MKKITIIMLLVLTGMMAMAQTSVWNGKKTIWTHGAGTESDPYLIESADHLAFLAYVVNKGYNTEGMYFRLTTDIDLNGSEDLPWLPIGLGNRWFSEDGCDRIVNYSFIYDDAFPYFRGHFDGGNHSVSNIYVEGEKNAGLFGAVRSMSYDTVVIENVLVVSGTIAGSTCGGIVANGRSAKLVISHCWNGATINGSSDVGGIVGNGVTQVIDCYNVGNVTGMDAGGIVGNSSSNILVEGCYNSGDIEGVEGEAVGGLVGYGIGIGMTINNSYNTGAVSALGGDSGGLAGFARNCTITNSYNAGEVSNTNHLGCLIGTTVGSLTVENAHYLNTCDQSEIGESQSEAFMRSQAFVDLLNSQNPEPVWTLDENNLNDGFPIFAKNILSVEVTVSPAECGEITGAGVYAFGSTATVTVTPNTDYQFSYWSKNGEVVSEDLSYSFVVTEDCQLKAQLSGNGVNEVAAAGLKIYPNPTQGQFTVEGTGHMTVTNLLGQTIFTRDVEGQTMVELPKGIYFVNLDGITRKVVVE